MAPKDNQHVEGFRAAAATWTDSRFISQEDLFNVCMFAEYLVNLAERDGWHYDGHSFRVNGRMCCLVVKGTEGETPQVVFTSGKTYTACVRIFLRKLDEGWLEWQVDKYRT